MLTSVPPMGRTLRTWQEPAPNVLSMFILNCWSISSGTKAWIVPAKPPPWTLHAPLRCSEYSATFRRDGKALVLYVGSRVDVLEVLVGAVAGFLHAGEEVVEVARLECVHQLVNALVLVEEVYRTEHRPVAELLAQYAGYSA